MVSLLVYICLFLCFKVSRSPPPHLTGAPFPIKNAGSFDVRIKTQAELLPPSDAAVLSSLGALTASSEQKLCGQSTNVSNS